MQDDVEVTQLRDELVELTQVRNEIFVISSGFKILRMSSSRPSKSKPRTSRCLRWQAICSVREQRRQQRRRRPLRRQQRRRRHRQSHRQQRRHRRMKTANWSVLNVRCSRSVLRLRDNFRRWSTNAQRSRPRIANSSDKYQQHHHHHRHLLLHRYQQHHLHR